jgi:hypothetical protein
MDGEHHRELVAMRFSLIPWWAKDKKGCLLNSVAQHARLGFKDLEPGRPR